MIKVGDLVFISTKGREIYPHETCNPHDQVGLVTVVGDWGPGSRGVQWQGYCYNSYHIDQVVELNNLDLILPLKAGKVERSILRALEDCDG